MILSSRHSVKPSSEGNSEGGKMQATSRISSPTIGASGTKRPRTIGRRGSSWGRSCPKLGFGPISRANQGWIASIEAAVERCRKDGIGRGAKLRHGEALVSPKWKEVVVRRTPSPAVSVTRESKRRQAYAGRLISHPKNGLGRP